jgi:hypothetical protein
LKELKVLSEGFLLHSKKIKMRMILMMLGLMRDPYGLLDNID